MAKHNVGLRDVAFSLVAGDLHVYCIITLPCIIVLIQQTPNESQNQLSVPIFIL